MPLCVDAVMPFSFRRVLVGSLLFTTIAVPTVGVAAEKTLLDYAHAEGICDCLAGRLERYELDGEFVETAVPFDEATGKDLRRYPPDRHVDYKHMKLELQFDDLNDRSFVGKEYLTVSPIGKAVSTLELNAAHLTIDDVSISDTSRKVERYDDGNMIGLHFDPPLAPGEDTTIIFEYRCIEPYDGLFFTPSKPEAPHYTAEVHTQGEEETNQHWFICHDYPNEQLTTELIVTVPAGLQVSSNGKLISHVKTGDKEVWHYHQDKPHVNYLVSLIIGQFDVVEIPHDRVPMRVWVPKGKGEQVLQTYGNTGRMIDLFEKRFGVAYPWAKYDQLLAKNFTAGGMENTSVTTMYPTAVYDERALLDSDLDSLIAHELAHQWFGDLITCKSWAHIWLNEGWATYGEALWFEERDGMDGYLNDMMGNFRVARRDRTTNEVPMVSIVHDDPGGYFGRAANPYSKGASILHMLRMKLGDDLFFRATKKYLERHAGGLAETNDLRYVFEEVSGLGLEPFFEQWCLTPGCPDLLVTSKYELESSELIVTVVQQQQIDMRTPAFKFDLPVHVLTNQGKHAFTIAVDSKETTFRRVLPGPPSVIAIDPFLHVLKSIKEEKSLPLWVAQATEGPMLAARDAAIDALGQHDTRDVVELLNAIATNDSEHRTLRNSAISALGTINSTRANEALVAMAKAGVPDARVRSHLIEQIGGIDTPETLELLVKAASDDESYNTRTAAISALADRKAKDHVDLIVGLVDYDSQHQRVRTSALNALAELDEPRGLDLAIKYSAYGNTDRARSSAIRTVGRLAKHDMDKAVPFLIGLLDDPEQGPRSAAIGALGQLGDRRALEPLNAIANADANPGMKDRAGRAIEQINESENQGEGGEGEGGGRGGRRRPAAATATAG